MIRGFIAKAVQLGVQYFVIAVLIYFVFTYPDNAAGLLRSVGRLVAGAGDGLGKFTASLI